MNKPNYKRLYELLRSLSNEGYQFIGTSELIHLYRKLDPNADNDSVSADLAILKDEKLVDFVRRAGDSEGAWRLAVIHRVI